MAKTKEETTEKTKGFRLSGAWRNESKGGGTYLSATITPSQVEELIKELTKFKETGVKLLTFPNTKEMDSQPDYTHMIYPYEKREA